MTSRKITIETCKHPRLVEFENSKFYAKDFESNLFKFLTIYDLDENVLAEYAHTDRNHWITPDNILLTNGKMVEEINRIAYKEVYLDLYVDDTFKPNMKLTFKRVFRYKLIPTGYVKRCKGGLHHKNKFENLYNIESVDDVTAFYSLGQVIPDIAKD